MNRFLKNALIYLAVPFISQVIFPACNSQKANKNQEERNQIEQSKVSVDWFEYTGNDSVYHNLKRTDSTYFNPIIPGFYPDPSICRVNDDYYLVNSSFSYFPGIPLFHSKDLVHWEQKGHVLNRPSQINLDRLDVSKGIFAPTIRHHKGTFYVISTLVGGKGNFIVTSEDPDSSWSDPIWLEEINGIDPSIFFDDNGKVYIVNNGPPPGKPKYDGHRAIWIQEFNKDKMAPGPRSGTRPRKVIVNGGVNIEEEPIWIEAPHIIKKDGYYYLIAAEGGTAEQHSEVVFRSKNAMGPYKPGPKNPILTQRHLNPGRPDPITCAGHADFVKTPQGNWWSVFLGCRPYQDNYYNTGRETFLLPVNWDTEWPFITLDPISYQHKKRHQNKKALQGEVIQNGNFTWKKDFEQEKLSHQWNFLRIPDKKWYQLKPEKSVLQIQPKTESIQSKHNPAFIGRRQQHARFSASVKLKTNQLKPAHKAGMICFQNQENYIYLGLHKKDSSNTVFIDYAQKDSSQSSVKQIAQKKIDKDLPQIFFKVKGKGKHYDFYYATEKDAWKPVKKNVDATNLSTKEAGGFVGTYIGVYAVGK